MYVERERERNRGKIVLVTRRNRREVTDTGVTAGFIWFIGFRVFGKFRCILETLKIIVPRCFESRN